MPLYYFKNYIFQRELPTEDSVMQALVNMEHAEGTAERTKFTILDSVRGFAFTQEYNTEPNNKCSWSRCWKHETGISIANDTSYDELFRKIPGNEPKRKDPTEFAKMLQELGTLDAEQFEVLVSILSNLAKATYENSHDAAWQNASSYLEIARNHISNRKGN